MNNNNSKCPMCDFKHTEHDEYIKHQKEKHPELLIMETYSLVGTREELEKYAKDMHDIGWKLRYNGTSGSWLGEPVYKIKTSGKQ